MKLVVGKSSSSGAKPAPPKGNPIIAGATGKWGGSAPKSAPKPAPNPMANKIKSVAKALNKQDSRVPAKPVVKSASKPAVKSASKPTVKSGSSSSSSSSSKSNSSSSKPTVKSSTSSSAKSTSNAAAQSLLDKARQAVSLMLDPKLQAITREISKDNALAEQGRTRATGDEALIQNGLTNIYSQLDSYLKAQQQGAQPGFQQAQQAMTGNYDDLSQHLASQYDQSKSSINEQLAKLGIGGAANTSRLDQDQAFLQGLAATNKANAANNIQQQQLNFNDTQNQLQSNSQASKATHSSQAKQALMDALTNINNNLNNQVMDLNSQYTDTEGQRGALTQQMLDQYESQAYDRAMQQQQQAFLNQMATNKFNLSADQFSADQLYRQAQLALQQQGLGIQQQNANTNATKAANTNPVKGLTGGLSYLSSNVKDTGLLGALQAALQRIDSNTHPFDPNNPTQGFNQTDPKQLPVIVGQGMNYLQQHYPSYNNAQAQAYLTSALKAYWGQPI